MASQEQLIKEVAKEIGWSQADVKKAVNDYGDVSTKEEIHACLLRYCGPELRKRNYQIGSHKRINAQQKNIIKQLIDQLTNIRDFYQNKRVPNLKDIIKAHEDYINDLLKQEHQADGER